MTQRAGLPAETGAVSAGSPARSVMLLNVGHYASENIWRISMHHSRRIDMSIIALLMLALLSIAEPGPVHAGELCSPQTSQCIDPGEPETDVIRGLV